MMDSDKTYLAGQSEPKLHVGYSTNQWNNQMPEHNPNLGSTSNNRQREYDPEDPLGPEVKGFEFTEQSIRRGFIRKVYAILSAQLSVTLGVVFLFGYHDGTRMFVAKNPVVGAVSIGVLFFTLFTMVCVESVRRKSPINFIFLSLFTLAQSYLVGMTTIRFVPQDVLIAIGITTALCLGLTIFALQTKWDFTVMGGILFVALILLVIFSFIAIFIPGKISVLIVSSIGALLFSIYLIYDTQMMMGGTHKYSISPEEYIFAALALYMDIINIFLYILSIIGASKN